jgi:hypothetical protein
MSEAEVILGVLLKCFRDVDEELLLWEHVVRYQRTRASGSAHGLRRGADNDGLVRRFVGQVGDNMLEEVVGNRYAAVGTAEDDDFLLGCWGGVLRYLHARIKIDRGYHSGIKRRPEKPRRCRTVMDAQEIA